MTPSVPLRLVRGDDPELPTALRQALEGGRPLAVLPEDDAVAARVREVLRPDEPVDADVAVVVATSGSTGEPKAVVLPLEAVRAAVAANEDRLGRAASWTSVLPPSAVGGLMVLARAVLGGATLRRRPADLADPALTPEGDGPHLLSVVPTQLHRVRDDPAALERLAQFDAVLVGGAAVDPTLLDDLHAAGVRPVTSYGMSETCGGCVYDGVPLRGVEVLVGEDGRIRISTPTAFSGYHHRPDLTAEVLVSPGTVLTGDRGRLDGGGRLGGTGRLDSSAGADGSARLTVLGRVDDVVITGGTNVDLADLERRLRAVLDAAEVAVTARPDPEWGTRIVAVLDEGTSLDLDDVQRRLRPLVADAALPRELLRLPSLPRLPGGKVDRMELRRLAAGVQETRV